LAARIDSANGGKADSNADTGCAPRQRFDARFEPYQSARLSRYNVVPLSLGADMRRREFISLLGGAVAWPLAARAQQSNRLIRLGVLGPTLNNPAAVDQYEAFRAQLAEFGFREGQNLIIDYQSVDDPRGAFIAAGELVRSRPELILTVGPEASLQAVIGASGFIPVVMIAVNFDPLARGYIPSLARPSGNITGFVFQQLELAQKQVELLSQAFPDRTRLAMLYDAQSADQLVAAERTAKVLNLHVQTLRLENPPYDFDTAFRSAASDDAQMMLVLSSPFFLPHRDRIVRLANTQHLPAMFIARHWAQAGGLMAYGADFPLIFRRAADYVAKILRGTKPADLPVEQATKFDLIVNLRTAKAIGIELPTAILLRANEVIE
jgi:putative ABC transport system substrate-binding protein